MKICGTFVCTGGQGNVQLRALDLRANWNCFALVDLFAGVVADDLDFLRVVVDRFVYDYDIALGRAILKVTSMLE